MSDQRPDPDLLLKQVNADEAQSKKGRLKIFFGASAGVGKTYAMLSAAHEALKQNVPLVIGIGRNTWPLGNGHVNRRPATPATEKNPVP